MKKIFPTGNQPPPLHQKLNGRPLTSNIKTPAKAFTPPAVKKLCTTLDGLS